MLLLCCLCSRCMHAQLQTLWCVIAVCTRSCMLAGRQGIVHVDDADLALPGACCAASELLHNSSWCRPHVCRRRISQTPMPTKLWACYQLLPSRCTAWSPGMLSVTRPPRGTRCAPLCLQRACSVSLTGSSSLLACVHVSSCRAQRQRDDVVAGEEAAAPRGAVRQAVRTGSWRGCHAQRDAHGTPASSLKLRHRVPAG